MASELGLVTEVWGEAELQGRVFLDAVVAWAGQFVAPNKPSLAVGRIKRAVQSGAAAEGLAANLEKRPPRFTER